jgi:hypothetical protein
LETKVDLGMIFGPKTDDVTGGWGNLLNEMGMFHNLYSSRNSIGAIKLRIVRYLTHG